MSRRIYWSYPLARGVRMVRHLGRTLRFYGVTVGWAAIGITVARKVTAWKPVEDTNHLKACPECGEVALEGQDECFGCGCEPDDDMRWREARD